MKTSLLPDIGTRVYGIRRKPNRETVVGQVVEHSGFPEGRALRVEDRYYASLSEAATAIVGHRRNGRRWWKQADGSPLTREGS